MKRETNDWLMGFSTSFGITFFAMMLVLGAVCFISYSRAQARNEPQKTQETAAPNTYLPSTEERLTLLVAGCEKAGMEPETYLLLGFLPDQGKIALCVLPSHTYLEYGGQGTTIGRMWRQGGLGYAQKGLAQYLDIPIHRRVLVETEDLDQLIRCIGPVDYDLAVDLDYELEDRQIAMPRGHYLMDGRRVMDVITYPAYKGGERERSDRAALLIAQIIRQSLPLFLEDAGAELQETALSVLDTDLSATDCLQRSAALQFLARLELPATATLFLEGTLSKNYTVYHLTQSCKERIWDIYRAPEQTQRSFRLGEPLPVQEPVQGEKKPSASSAAESRSPSSASSSSSAPERQPVDSGNPSSREAESSPSEVEQRALDSGSYPPFQEPQRLERP